MSPSGPKPHVHGEVEQCVVCAWRADCKKKFNVEGGPTRCPDFSRDLTIKKEPETEQ